MSHWENTGKSDEWYTPKYIFDALDIVFDIDVASPIDRFYCHVPAKEFYIEGSLQKEWRGFCWMNPPFGGRNSISLWLDKMASHGNGIALVPDRTSAPWFQKAAQECDLMMLISGKVKFIDSRGSVGKSPSTGTALLGYGPLAKVALDNAARNDLGILFKMRHCKI